VADAPRFDPRRLRPGELCRILNSTPLGEVTSERVLQRHRNRAGLRIDDGTGKGIDLFRYVAWLAVRRLARRQAASSESPARYRPRPPLRETSRLTVEGDRPILDAIARSESPAARPRVISSRSSRVRDRSERVRSGGEKPPALRTIANTEAGARLSASPIAVSVWPSRQRRQRSRRSSGVSLQDRPDAMQATFRMGHLTRRGVAMTC